MGVRERYEQRASHRDAVFHAACLAARFVSPEEGSVPQRASGFLFASLQQHNARLIERDRNRDWVWLGTMGLVLLLVGVLAGILVEKRQTSDELMSIRSQIGEIRAKLLPAVLMPPKAKGEGKTLTLL